MIQTKTKIPTKINNSSKEKHYFTKNGYSLDPLYYDAESGCFDLEMMDDVMLFLNLDELHVNDTYGQMEMIYKVIN